MKKKGFFIIQILLYISLSLIFLLLLFQFTYKVYTNYITFNEKTSFKCNLFNCLDLLTRDLTIASKEINFWKKRGNNEIIFSVHENEYDIGWCLNNNKVYRIEGKFNSNNWTKKEESLVCTNIDKLEIAFNELKLSKSISASDKINIIYVKITGKLGSEVIELEKSVSLKNGKL